MDMEPFVDAGEAAKFLCMSPQQIRKLAVNGRISAHNYGVGHRRFWRFKLSELAKPLLSEASSVPRKQE